MTIFSLGDLLLDVLVRYDPLLGEADTGADAVRIMPGGSAANFAVQAARLGAQVRFMSRVGRDWEGEMLVRSLEGEGVVPAVSISDDAPTGRVLVMLDAQGHRRMWSYPGASRLISPANLDPAWFRGLDAFHLTGYSLLRDEPRAAASGALQMARDAGVRLCTLDPNPPHLIAAYGPSRFMEMLHTARFDVLFPNLEEGGIMAGESEPERMAAALLEVSPIVALKMGAQGCMVATRQECFTAEAAPIEHVADATGAGDAFAAAFVVEYGRTGDLRAAATAANRHAAQVVARVGGR